MTDIEPKLATCALCDGSGRRSGQHVSWTCKRCGGSGNIPQSQLSPGMAPCDSCGTSVPRSSMEHADDMQVCIPCADALRVTQSPLDASDFDRGFNAGQESARVKLDGTLAAYERVCRERRELEAERDALDLVAKAAEACWDAGNDGLNSSATFHAMGEAIETYRAKNEIHPT